MYLLYVSCFVDRLLVDFIFCVIGYMKIGFVGYVIFLMCNYLFG